MGTLCIAALFSFMGFMALACLIIWWSSHQETVHYAHAKRKRQPWYQQMGYPEPQIFMEDMGWDDDDTDGRV